MTPTPHSLDPATAAEPAIDSSIQTDPAANQAALELAIEPQTSEASAPPVPILEQPAPASQRRPSVLMRMFVTEPDLAPAQTTPYGLHPKVSLGLLLAAVCVAIIGLISESTAVHRVTGLCQGVIFGLLFAPQMRIWLPRAPAPLLSSLQSTPAAPASTPVERGPADLPPAASS